MTYNIDGELNIWDLKEDELSLIETL